MPRIVPSKLFAIANLAEKNIKTLDDEISSVWDEIYKSAANGNTKKEFSNLSRDCVEYFSSEKNEIFKINNNVTESSSINDKVFEIESELEGLIEIKKLYDSHIEALKTLPSYIYLEHWLKNNLDLAVKNDFSEWVGYKFSAIELVNLEIVEEFIFNVEKIIKSKKDSENQTKYIKLNEILHQVLIDLQEQNSEDFQFTIVDNIDELIEGQELKLSALKAKNEYAAESEKKRTYLFSWSKNYDSNKIRNHSSYTVNSLAWLSSSDGQSSLEKIEDLFLSYAKKGKKSLTFFAEIKLRQPFLNLVAENKIYEFVTLFDFERVFSLLGYLVEKKFNKNDLMSVTLKFNKDKSR